MILEHMNNGFNRQEQTLQCLDNKISNVRAEVPAAVSTALIPLQTEIRAVKQKQTKQDDALRKATADIQRLFAIVGARQPGTPTQNSSSSTAGSEVPRNRTEQSVEQRGARRSEPPPESRREDSRHQARDDQWLQDRVRAAVEHMARLQREAESKKNVVFLRRSNQAEADFVLTEQDVETYLGRHAMNGDYLIQNRGKSGYAVTFYGCGASRGEDRAQKFVADVARHQPNVWCVVERPQELREIVGRAHDFGGAFRRFCENCGRDVKPYYSFHAEFLVISDQVIAPLPLIPAKSAWHNIFCTICDLLEANPERVNYRQPLQSQMWKNVLAEICEASNRVEMRDAPPPSQSTVQSHSANHGATRTVGIGSESGDNGDDGDGDDHCTSVEPAQ
jgi:hypothetical protein